MSGYNAFFTHVLLSEQFSKQMNWKKYYPEFFIYKPPADFVFAAAGSQTQAFSIDADASFILGMLTGTAITAALLNTPAGSDAFVNGTVQLFDTGAGKTLFSQPIQFNELFGQSGRDRYILLAPRILQNNSTMQITITHVSPAACTYSLSFHGAKMLNRGANAVTAQGN